jgi:hypothetical protein
MANWEKKQEDNEIRREELIRMIEYSLVNLSLEELESLYYDMLTKDYIQP